MTRPNPLLMVWHRLTSPSRDAQRRRHRNAVRSLEAAKRSGGRTANAAPTLPAGFSWQRAARISIATGTTVVLIALLCLHLLPNSVSLRLGDIATEDIVARRTVRYEDTAATKALRDAAIARVGRRYDSLPSAIPNALATTSTVFDMIDRWEPRDAKEAASVKADSVPVRSALAELQRLRVNGISKATIVYLFQMSPAERATLRSSVSKMTEEFMARPITDSVRDLQSAQSEVFTDRELAAAFPDKQQRAVVANIVSSSLVPNRIYNERATSDQQAAAAAAVLPEMRQQSAGETIIRKGERVTNEHLEAFRALGLQSVRLDAGAVATIAAMIVGMIVFVIAYLRVFHKKLYYNTSLLTLLAIQTVLAVVGLKTGSMLLGLPFSGVHFGYLGMMCVASAGMAIALLIDVGVATLVVALLSVASGMILNNELRYTLLTLGSSLVGIVSVATLKNRADYLRAILVLCTSNAVLSALVGHLEGDQTREFVSGVLWSGISGLVAVAFFYLGVALFERWFGITTDLRLLDLSDPATPVLQEFRLKAPGTYAHSLMVGNLAHAAAEGIGANSLLCRVAAYYHDLGKMNRPEFFIENQSGLDNVHDRLAPSLSALILVTHVKDGVEMGKALGLPPRVIELIEQHHGTTLIKFFYHKATGGISDTSMEAQFRYPGPKPQTKEAAILLLADSVEAASRSLDKPTPARIEAFVSSIIEDKRADGQLDECDLTLWELKTVQELFARTLSGALHARIAYPGGDKNKVSEPAAVGLPETADLPTPNVTFAPPSTFVPVLTISNFGDDTGTAAAIKENADAEETFVISGGRRRRSTRRPR